MGLLRKKKNVDGEAINKLSNKKAEKSTKKKREKIGLETSQPLNENTLLVVSHFFSDDDAGGVKLNDFESIFSATPVVGDEASGQVSVMKWAEELMIEIVENEELDIKPEGMNIAVAHDIKMGRKEDKYKIHSYGHGAAEDVFKKGSLRPETVLFLGSKSKQDLKLLKEFSKKCAEEGAFLIAGVPYDLTPDELTGNVKDILLEVADNALVFFTDTDEMMEKLDDEGIMKKVPCIIESWSETELKTAQAWKDIIEEWTENLLLISRPADISTLLDYIEQAENLIMKHAPLKRRTKVSAGGLDKVVAKILFEIQARMAPLRAKRGKTSIVIENGAQARKIELGSKDSLAFGPKTTIKTFNADYFKKNKLKYKITHIYGNYGLFVLVTDEIVGREKKLGLVKKIKKKSKLFEYHVLELKKEKATYERFENMNKEKKFSIHSPILEP